MTITVYHVIQETKKIIKTDKYTELDMDLSAGEEYTIDIVSDEIDYEENTYYFLFALKNGSVIPYAAKETPSGIDTTFTGVAMDDEVKDTWIMYYSSVKSDPWGTLEKAVMSTEKSNARLKFGDSLSTISTVVEESEDTEIFSIAIDTGFMSDSFFTYGSSYSPSCEVDMSKCQYAKQGKFFTVEFEIDGIWMDFGTFYINSVPKKTSEYIHFTGSGLLDSVLSKNDGNVYFHNETLPGMISQIKNVWGVTVIIEFEDELKSVEDGTYWENSKVITLYERTENESGTFAYKDITFSPREYLSQVAVALHANVIERNGIIYLQRADNYPVYLKFDEDCYNSEPEVDMSIRYTPSPVKTSCKQSAVNLLTSESLTPYYLDKDNVNVELNIAKPVTGSDSNIELVYYPLTIDCDPLWALTTDISEKYWGNLGKYPFKTMAGRTTSPVYMPIELEFSGYNPCIYAGSNVYVEVNGEMAPFLIGNVSISWDGGFTMSVSTPCDIHLDQNTSSTVGNSSSAGSGTKVTNPDIYKNLLIDKELDEVSENAIANKAVSVILHDILGKDNDYGDRIYHNMVIGGSGNKISGGYGSTAIGTSNTLGDDYESIVVGSENSVYDSSYSAVIGYKNSIPDTNSAGISMLLIGGKNTISGKAYQCLVFGLENGNHGEVSNSIFGGSGNTLGGGIIQLGSFVTGSGNTITSNVARSIICSGESTINAPITGSMIGGYGQKIQATLEILDSIIYGSENVIAYGAFYSYINGQNNVVAELIQSCIVSGNNLIIPSNMNSALVLGKYNDPSDVDGYIIVGGGTSDDVRKNIFKLSRTGEATFKGDVEFSDDDNGREYRLSASAQFRDSTDKCKVYSTGPVTQIYIPSFSISDTKKYSNFYGTVTLNESTLEISGMCYKNGDNVAGEINATLDGEEIKETAIAFTTQNNIDYCKIIYWLTTTQTKVDEMYTLQNIPSEFMINSLVMQEETIDIDFSNYFS